MASYFTKFNQLTKQSPNQPFKQAGKLLTQQAAVPFPSPRTLNIDSKKMCNFKQAAFKYIACVQMNEDFIYIVHFQCTLNMKARELETRSPKKMFSQNISLTDGSKIRDEGYLSISFYSKQ